jgi:predicted AlkP superfamily phosphohydrolase/phosphomutase
MSCRTLVLGVDGATFDVIDPLVAAGRMPALAGLMRDGVRARLRSTCPPVSAPAWVTFLTGQQPGRHGVYNFQNLSGRRYSGFSETLVNSSYFRGTTLLDHLGATTELRALAYRIPMTFPAWDVRNAVLVSGPPVPDRRRAYARPSSVEAEVGPVSTLTNDEVAAAKRTRNVGLIDDCNRFELELLERVVTDHLGRGTELVIGFTGIADSLHHFFWGFHDPTSPVHEPDAPEPLRTVITRAYEAIDRTIGRILARVGDDTAVIVLSDHGGGPFPARQLNLNCFLREAGLLTAAGGRAQVATGVRRMIDRARPLLPGRAWMKRHLPEGVQRRIRGLRNATAAIAWERTQAYAIPIYYPVTGVWVNLAGRQPKGTVQPGAAYERLRHDLAARLAGLRDPVTGAPLVAGVWKREDVWQGPHTDDAPDLVVETVAGYHGGFELEQLVTDVPRPTLAAVSGSHQKEGILVAAGGPFRRGVAIDPPHLADVLPTALHLIGAPLPDDLDGRVIADALQPEFLAGRPVALVSRANREGGRVALSDDDEGEMRKFLQGLGYVE